MKKSTAQDVRWGYIDRLKAIGLLLVILAHVDPPGWLAQLRSFDVPLLVFVSAYLARASYSGGNVLGYYKKRFLRLAVPAWIFTAVFWCAQSVVLPPPSLNTIIKSILFQRDTDMVGMLWVIWVYIVCALLIPLISKAKYSWKTGVLFATVLVVFQLLCSLTGLPDNRLLYCTVFTVIPYGFVTWLGYYYCDMQKKDKWFIGGVFAALFAGLAVWLSVKNGAFAPVSDYKYPAQIYYLSYAMPITFVLFALLPRLDKYPVSGLTRFISRSSLWIYLWHMLILYAVKMVIDNNALWWIQYLMIVGISVFIVWIQNQIVALLQAKTRWGWLKIFRG